MSEYEGLEDEDDFSEPNAMQSSAYWQIERAIRDYYDAGGSFPFSSRFLLNEDDPNSPLFTFSVACIAAGGN